MGRAPCCDKANVKKGPWSPEEDAKLKAYIEEYGTGGNWIALPQKIGLKRCGKSCRLSWLNYLKPNIKHGGFTEEEDNIICSLYISIGSSIKNYWNTKLKKKLLGRRKQTQINSISVSNQDPNKDATNLLEEDNSSLQNLSNSSQERIQFHKQLQSLKDPFFVYNNLALWPKLHPLQQKMIQNLQSLMNDNSTLLNQHSRPINLQPEQGQMVNLYEACTDSLTLQEDCPQSNLRVDELESSMNVISSSDCLPNAVSSMLPVSASAGITAQLKIPVQPVPTFTQEEIDEFLSDKSVGFLQREGQISEFDCFTEVYGSNRFDANNSVSANSWDSSSVLHEAEGIYQDHLIASYKKEDVGESSKVWL